jgi:hypothetical protein
MTAATLPESRMVPSVRCYGQTDTQPRRAESRPARAARWFFTLLPWEILSLSSISIGDKTDR